MSDPKHTFERFHTVTSGHFEPDRPELFDALPEDVQDDVWVDLAAKCDARNEDLRTLDPLYDTSSQSFTSLRREVLAQQERCGPKTTPFRHLRVVPPPQTREDVLREIPPSTYVEALTGEQVPSSGVIRCPLPDHDDRTPSFKVYDDPERGWYCFGCHRAGRIYEFGSALLGLGTRGDEFRELRRRLALSLLGREAA